MAIAAAMASMMSMGTLIDDSSVVAGDVIETVRGRGVFGSVVGLEG